MKFYFIIKYLFSIHFAKHYSSTPSASCVGHSDIVVVYSSIDTLNVIYRQHTLILLVFLLQIYVHSSPYTLLITRNALKK